MENNEVFFMVWREGTGAIHHRHETRESALFEAERLARENPSVRFYVVEATDYVVWKAVQHVELSGIPF